jgi:hypothetical protein
MSSIDLYLKRFDAGYIFTATSKVIKSTITKNTVEFTWTRTPVEVVATP